uniref:Uncharacterized protein n=1 Tax=Tetradesmus obliquus TaxID=3088 RepID=A0A383W9L7_TETOB|eukprot:jgi/Sobl393_1/769/SZX73694.1
MDRRPVAGSTCARRALSLRALFLPQLCSSRSQHCYEVCFPATAALLVEARPSWADRQALAIAAIKREPCHSCGVAFEIAFIAGQTG